MSFKDVPRGTVTTDFPHLIEHGALKMRSSGHYEGIFCDKCVRKSEKKNATAARQDPHWLGR